MQLMRRWVILAVLGGLQMSSAQTTSRERLQAEGWARSDNSCSLTCAVFVRVSPQTADEQSFKTVEIKYQNNNDRNVRLWIRVSYERADASGRWEQVNEPEGAVDVNRHDENHGYTETTSRNVRNFSVKITRFEFSK